MRTLTSLFLVLALSAGLRATAATVVVDPVDLDDKEMETALGMRVLASVLESLSAAQRVVPASEERFRAVDARFLEEMDPLARPLVPRKDAWGRPYQVVHVAPKWVVGSAGPDGAFQAGGVMASATGEVAYGTEGADPGEHDLGDDLLYGDDQLLAPARPSRHVERPTMADMRSIATAIESYAIDHDAYPCPRPGLVPLSEVSELLEPVYIRDLPLQDGWGHPFLFSCSAEGYGIVSLGADGRPGANYGALGPGLAGMPAGMWSADPDIVFVDGQFVAWPEGTQR